MAPYLKLIYKRRIGKIWHHTITGLDFSWSSAPQGCPNIFPFKERFIYQKVKIKLKVVFHNQLRLCTCFFKSPTFRKRKLLKIKIKRKMGQPFSYFALNHMKILYCAKFQLNPSPSGLQILISTDLT